MCVCVCVCVCACACVTERVYDITVLSLLALMLAPSRRPANEESVFFFFIGFSLKKCPRLCEVSYLFNTKNASVGCLIGLAGQGGGEGIA